MEKGTFYPEGQPKSLRERLIEVAFKPQSLTPRRMDLSNLPKPMKIAQQDSSETFVRLVERVAEFQSTKSEATAKNILAHCAQLGRRLDDLLPGNDEGVRFFHQGLNFLEIANPELAEDVGRVIQKAWDEKRFKDKR